MEDQMKSYYERPEAEFEKLIPGSIICASQEDGGDDDF